MRMFKQYEEFLFPNISKSDSKANEIKKQEVMLVRKEFKFFF